VIARGPSDVYRFAPEGAHPRSPAKPEGRKPAKDGLQLANGLQMPENLAADQGFMTTEEGRMVVQYLVGCALPLGASVTKEDPEGNQYTFEGIAGLAPEWEEGECEVECQEWVSACLLARVNAFGLHVQIEMAADHEAIGTDTPCTHQEGAFFGNLFADPATGFACSGSEVDYALSMGRACAHPGDDCDLPVLGPCTAVCNQQGPFSECRLGEDAEAPRTERVITTFLQ
jgi:hypothetical protein